MNITDYKYKKNQKDQFNRSWIRYKLWIIDRWKRYDGCMICIRNIMLIPVENIAFILQTCGQLPARLP